MSISSAVPGNANPSEYVARLYSALVAEYHRIGLANTAVSRANAVFEGLNGALEQFRLDGLDIYFEHMSRRLVRAATAFTANPDKAQDLSQIALTGFIQWLLQKPLQLEIPSSFKPYLYKRLHWASISSYRRRIGQPSSDQFVSIEDAYAVRNLSPALLRREHESTVVLRVMIEDAFDRFYARLGHSYRPAFVEVLRTFWEDRNPGDRVTQFMNARIMVFTELADYSRSTDEVEEFGSILGLSINATQAALTRTQPHWLKTERRLFITDPSPRREFCKKSMPPSSTPDENTTPSGLSEADLENLEHIAVCEGSVFAVGDGQEIEFQEEQWTC